MSSAKQGLFVVVWEWENKQRRWRPYPPGVTQQLERAHDKNLTFVFLKDSDPNLKHYIINLIQKEQECDLTGEKAKVRRNFYPQSSPAGQGAVWQWAGDTLGDWHVYDMNVQCVIEEAWATGAQTVNMGDTFPMCPYVINFCNLTQMNSRTSLVRSIRRIQQASYPVGKPPITPQACGPGGLLGNCNSTNNMKYNIAGKALPGGSPNTNIERPRRRGSRSEDMETSSTEPKPRKFFDKIIGRGHSSSNSANTTNSKGAVANPPGGSDISDGRSLMCPWNSKTNSPPRPLPRSSVPPVPKPRTSFPPSRPQLPSEYRQHVEPFHDQQKFSQPQHVHEERDDHKPSMSRGLRNESAVGRFGSNHTINSDCSSLISGRRPSVDTISTYLSVDSATIEDDYKQNARSHYHDDSMDCEPVVDQLIAVDKDDDVFSEDPEVCAVMRGATRHSSPPRAPSPLPYNQHNQYHRRNSPPSRHSPPPTSQHLSHRRHSSPTRRSHSGNQMSPQQQCHFKPIVAAQAASDLGLQMNGVKRKRTGARATPHGRSGGGSDVGSMGDHGQDAHFNRKHNHQHNHHKSHHGSRAPIAPEDKLLLQYTSTVTSPPDEMCSICMWSLQESSGYSDDEDSKPTNSSHFAGVMNDGVVSLNLCEHMFHLACVRQMAKSSPQFLECPNCKTLHGEKLGNQPNGHMSVKTLHGSLPGYSGTNTLQITYSISDGIQGAEHPQPGRPYRAIGFPRTAYLPNNKKGNKVLKLLQEAWRRRLIFTIGTSVTMGIDNAVTWNEIHHKTEWNNRNGHGYPDPNYLDNVLMEMALQGVTETTLV